MVLLLDSTHDGIGLDTAIVKEVEHKLQLRELIDEEYITKYRILSVQGDINQPSATDRVGAHPYMQLQIVGFINR